MFYIIEHLKIQDVLLLSNVHEQLTPTPQKNDIAKAAYNTA